MDWQDELSPVKNWQGWLGAIVLVFVLGILPGLLGDGPTGHNTVIQEEPMCLHLGDWSPGYRSWGDDIPGFAQGCYFPGDEPGHLCTITG